MRSLVTTNNIPATFVTWMEANSIFTVDDFVWAARNESSRVDDEIIVVSLVVTTFADKIAIERRGPQRRSSSRSVRTRKLLQLRTLITSRYQKGTLQYCKMNSTADTRLN